MGIKAFLTDLKTGEAFASKRIWKDPFTQLNGSVDRILEVVDAQKVYGTFNSETRTEAGTTTITTPSAAGSLWITDLLISGEKQNASTVEVRFTDGVNTETLFLASQTDAPASFAHSVGGRFQGWKNARIDMVTVGTADATVTLGYVKMPTGLEYAKWDSLR